jgi:acetyltransferase
MQDLAVIATPVATVPGIIHECGEHDKRVAIVHSGFIKARKNHRHRTQTALLAEARR